MAVRPVLLVREFERLRREQWLSPDEMAARRWQRFLVMLNCATTHSPFYRQKFAAAGLDPGDIKTPDDIYNIPITTRDELRATDTLLADSHAQEALHESSSSGSTGKNVRTFFDDEAWLIGKYLLKARARWALGIRPTDRIALIKASEFKNNSGKEILLRQRSFSLHDPLDATLTALRQYRPTVMYGFPGHFVQLAQESPDLPPLKCVITSGEMLTEATRTQIEDGFGAPVYDVYGCTELKEIAWECPERAGYHINADRLLVETLPGAGDEPDGMLTVTSLYNFAMPLIRYQPGDTGRLLDRQCPCGRGLPLMAPGFGRSMDYFRLPTGALVSPYTVSGAVEAVPGILQFQLVQTKPQRLVVRIVPAGENDANLSSSIVTALSPLLPGIQLSVETTPAIAREKSGKYRKAISYVAGAMA